MLLNNTLPTHILMGAASAAHNPDHRQRATSPTASQWATLIKDGMLDIAVSYLHDNDVQVLVQQRRRLGFTTGLPMPVGNQPYLDRFR